MGWQNTAENARQLGSSRPSAQERQPGPGVRRARGVRRPAEHHAPANRRASSSRPITHPWRTQAPNKTSAPAQRSRWTGQARPIPMAPRGLLFQWVQTGGPATTIQDPDQGQDAGHRREGSSHPHLPAASHRSVRASELRHGHDDREQAQVAPHGTTISVAGPPQRRGGPAASSPARARPAAGLFTRIGGGVTVPPCLPGGPSSVDVNSSHPSIAPAATRPTGVSGRSELGAALRRDTD